MAGSIQRRGRAPSWRLRVYAGDGKYVTETVNGPEKEARERLSRLVIEVADGRRAPSARVSFGDLLDEWMATKEPDLAPKTMELYRGIVNRHLRPALGDRPLHRLGPRDLDQLYAKLRESGLSTTTVRKVHNIANGALGSGVRWGYLAVNPAPVASPPSVQRAEICPPTATQMEELLAAANDYDEMFGVLVHLAVSTGARRGELAALRWSDIDLDARTVRIARAIDGITITEKTTKTKRVRVVPIDAMTAEGMRWYRENCAKVAVAADGVREATGFVFSRELNGARPLRPDAITAVWRQVCRVVGVSCRFHDIRHFCGSMLVANGVDVRTVADRLGHATPVVTLAFYAHSVSEMQFDAADVIGGIIHAQSRTDP